MVAGLPYGKVKYPYAPQPTKGLLVSPNAKQLLAVRSPNMLARFLLGQPYVQFRRLIYPKPRYTAFPLAKRLGGHRTIHAPGKILKSIQRKLAHLLLEIYGEGKPSVHSFVRGRSVLTNARQHATRKRFVLNLDLQDFFGSVHFGRVKGLFQKPPFSLPAAVASVLAQVCCYEKRLPQGAPTSPVISNFISRALDTELQQLARTNRATYSRYCDDITFSFSISARRNLPAAIVNPALSPLTGVILAKTIEKHGFTINEKKVRLRGRTERMEVTGLTVNEFPNVRRRFIDEIRGALHAWQVHGIVSAQAVFPTKYVKQLRTRAVPKLENVLRGKLLYLRMVRGSDDRIYSRLAERFNSLCIRDSVARPLPVLRRVRDYADLQKSVFVLECYVAGRKGAWSHHQGTAFYVDGVGLVTCEHVLRRSRPRSLDAIKYCGENAKDRITISNSALNYWEKPVTIRHTDPKADIAILNLPVGFPTTTIPLRLRANQANAHDRVKLAGFPNYTPGRSLSVVDADIISTYPQFGLSHFDISTTIRAGNSGGPVLDAGYYVAGVAKEGATQQSGNNAVLGVDELRAVIARSSRK